MAAAAATRAMSGSLSTSGVDGLRPAAETSAPARRSSVVVRAAGKNGKGAPEEEEKTSFFTSITDALDFSAARSEKDAELLRDARSATRSGQRMTQEQVGALKRKVGGTKKDFFKEWIEVDGAYVDDGWVDKTCKYCKKDTKGSPRQVDSGGRYAHVECAENAPKAGFFSKLFGKS